MSEDDNIPRGPFTRWWDSRGGWRFQDCDTLKEAIEWQCFTTGAPVITRPVKWEPRETPANVADYIMERRSNCNENLRDEGKPYPRTCAVCGLGRCRYRPPEPA